MLCKRYVGLSVVLAGAVGLLAGCGDDDTPAPPPEKKKPNLTVDTVSFVVTPVEQSTLVAVNRTLRNTGNAAATVFSVAYYLSVDTVLDTVADELAGTESVGLGLVAGAVSAGQYSITASGTIGTYYCFAVIDSASQVGESNEGDNESLESSNTLAVAATGSLDPDLTGLITASPASVYIGQTMSVSVSATNSGGAACGTTSEGMLYLSTTAAYDGTSPALLAAPVTINNLNPGETQAILRTTIAVPVARAYLVWVVDTLDDVAPEMSEANNEDSALITVSTPPEIEATGTIIPPPGTVPEGVENYTVREGSAFTVRSTFDETAGTAWAGGFNVAVYRSTDLVISTGGAGGDAVVGSGAYTNTLGASGSDTLDVSVTIPTGFAGTSLYLGSHVDSGDAVFEADNVNNVDGTTEVLQVDVIAAGLGAGQYDLVAREASVDARNRELVALADFDSSLRFESVGDVPPGSFTATVYFSVDNNLSGDDTAVGSTVVTSVAGPVWEDILATCTAPATLGFYYVILDVDTADQVAETDETNNIGYGSGWPVEVIAAGGEQIDLRTWGGGGGGPAPTGVGLDVPFEATCSFEVDSNVDVAGAFVVRFYASSDQTFGDAGDVEIGSKPYPAGLPAGYESDDGPSEDFVTVLLPSGMGFNVGDPVYIGFVIDADDDIDETDENNNSAELMDTNVIASANAFADLIVIAYLDMEDEGPSTPVPPTYWVAENSTGVAWPMLVSGNFGSRASAVSVPVEFYLTVDQSVSTPGDDEYLGSHLAPAMGGGEYKFEFDVGSLSFSGVGAGSYYLWAYIDPADAVDEGAAGGETNNDSALGALGMGAYIPLEVYGGAIKPELEGKPSIDSHEGDFSDSIEINGMVTNSCLDILAETSLATLWLSLDNDATITTGSDLYIDGSDVPVIQPGAQAWSHFGLAPPVNDIIVGGPYYLKLAVDAAAEIDEQDETNNVSNLEFHCLLLEQFTAAPGGWTISGTANPWVYDTVDDRMEVVGPGLNVSQDERLMTPVVNCSTYQKVVVTFVFDHDPWSSGGQLTVEVSNDGGTSWHYVRNNYDFWGSSGDGVIDISKRAAGQATVQVRWRFESWPFDTGHFYLDDVMILATP